MKHLVFLRALRRWLAGSHTFAAAARRGRIPRTRPTLEGLEERVAPASTPLVSPGVTAAHMGEAGYGRGADGVLSSSDVVTVSRQSTSFNNAAAQTVTLTARVTSATGVALTDGNVTFTVANLPPVTAAVNGRGVASTALTLPAAFPAGTETITATYDDPSVTSPGGTGTGTLTVRLASTSVTVSNESATFNSGAAQQVTVSATVTSANGGTVNEGTITFHFKSLPPVTAVVNSSGVATATVTLPPGFMAYDHTISAVYADTANVNDEHNFSRTHNWALLTVNPAATTTTAADVSAAFNPTSSQQVMLTAAVSSPTGGTVHEGTVTFIVDDQWLTAAVNSSGVATAALTLPAGFPAGSYAIYAIYTDSANALGEVNYSYSTNLLSPATLTIETTASTAAIVHALPPSTAPRHTR
jgi:hypothetical protein